MSKDVRKFFDEELSVKMKEMVEKRFPVSESEEYKASRHKRGRHWRGARSALPQGGNGAEGGTPQAPHTKNKWKHRKRLYSKASAAKKIKNK